MQQCVNPFLSAPCPVLTQPIFVDATHTLIAQDLSSYAQANLISEMRRRPDSVVSFLCYIDGVPAGLANCIVGYVYDIYIRSYVERVYVLQFILWVASLYRFSSLYYIL